MHFIRVALLALLCAGVGVAQTVVRIAPPPPVRVGVVGHAPRRGCVWVGGYQRWTGNRYVWVAGKWVRPPRAGAVWVSPPWRVSGVWILCVIGNSTDSIRIRHR
jgi:hypothetical protein